MLSLFSSIGIQRGLLGEKPTSATVSKRSALQSTFVARLPSSLFFCFPLFLSLNSLSLFSLHQVPPHPTRPHQVWVLAKRSSYFYGAHSPVSNTTFIEASEALGVQFVGAWEEEGGFPGVTNIGNGRLLSKEDFQKEIVNSRAIVGLG